MKTNDDIRKQFDHKHSRGSIRKEDKARGSVE